MDMHSIISLRCMALDGRHSAQKLNKIQCPYDLMLESHKYKYASTIN